MFGPGGCPPGGRGRGRFMGGFFKHLPWFGGGDHLLNGLDLTDEQVEKIAELKQKSFAKIGHARVDAMDLMQTLFRELGAAQIDHGKVSEIKSKITAHKAEMSELMVDNMLAFAEILTPEQRKTVRLKNIRQFLGGGGPDMHEHHHHEHHQEYREYPDDEAPPPRSKPGSYPPPGQGPYLPPDHKPRN